MSKGPTDERVPLAVKGIQVNFCKNPKCPNFGVPASTQKQPIGRSVAKKDRDAYRVVAIGPANVRALLCLYCREKPAIKSNLGIHEELSRFWTY